MNAVVLRLNIPAAEFAKAYAVPGAQLQARAESGVTVALPAAAFKRFVMRSGLAGRFRVRFDDAGRLLEIERLPT